MNIEDIQNIILADGCSYEESVRNEFFVITVYPGGNSQLASTVTVEAMVRDYAWGMIYNKVAPRTTHDYVVITADGKANIGHDRTKRTPEEFSNLLAFYNHYNQEAKWYPVDKEYDA